MLNNNFENSIKFNHKTSFSENNLAKVFGILFFIFACISWVNFGLNDYDSQPWAFILSCIFLVLVSKKIFIPKNFIPIFFLVIVGLIFSIFVTTSIDTFTLLRAISMYLTLPIMYLAFYNYFVRYDFPIKIFVFMNFLWIFFGLLEIFYPEFINSISHARRDPSRGQTSLAPEATFFGIYLFFSSWILIEANKFTINNKVKLMLLINFMFIIFLTKSSMVIFFLFIVFIFIFIQKLRIFLFNFLISKKNIVTFLKYFLFISAFLFFFWDLLDGSRFNFLLSRLSNYPISQFVIMDDSINSRMESIVFSVIGAFNNFLLPGGFDTFIDTRKELLETYSLNDLLLNKVESNKIMSWVGSILYELGIFGFISIIFFYNAIYQSFRGSSLYYGLIFLILLSAVPVAFPLIPMMFALMVYNKKKINMK